MRHTRAGLAGRVSRRPRSRGFSLMESLVASAVLAVGVAAVCETVVSGHKQTAEAIVSLRGDMLVDALMQEVLSKPYTDPQGGGAVGPESGETSRSLFDNIDDYHNYTDGPTGLRDAANVLYPTEFQRFTRRVTVTSSSLSVSGLPAAVGGLSITVTATNTSGRYWSGSRFVADRSATSGN